MASAAAPRCKSFEFPQALLQAFAAPVQRLVDGLGRGGEPPLQDGEREPDRARSLVVGKRLGAIELLAHVVGDFLVELRLGVGKLVRHGIGDALREKRRAVELEQVLLHHPAHQVGNIHLVDAVAKAALETVAVEQRHEELEILFLAVMGGCGHQEEVPRQAREKLPEVIALGVFDLAAEERGRELVRLVADDQVPAAFRDLELVLYVFVARELVETGDDEVVFEEPVAGTRRFELVVRQDFEGKLETAVKFVLPLLGQAAGADDETALQVAARDQFLDEQARP